MWFLDAQEQMRFDHDCHTSTFELPQETIRFVFVQDVL